MPIFLWPKDKILGSISRIQNNITPYSSECFMSMNDHTEEEVPLRIILEKIDERESNTKADALIQKYERLVKDNDGKNIDEMSDTFLRMVEAFIDTME